MLLQSTVSALVFALLWSGAALAQCGSLADDPVINSPYSAVRRVSTTKLNSDGTSSSTDETAQVARDSKGRTYHAGERRWTTMVDGKSVELSETLVRIDDPVANTETKWDTSLKQVKVVHFSSLSEPTPAMRDRIEAFSFDGLAKRAGATKLGTREIQGLSVEGTRYQTENSTHECWFSPDLKLTVRKTDEFSDCAFTDQLEGISLQEPDVSRYLPPPDYSVKHVHIDLSRLPK